jgi:hypothetical protein
MRVPSVEIPPEMVAEIRRAGKILAEAGWEVELAEPPELERVTETWIHLSSIDFSVLCLEAAEIIERRVDRPTPIDPLR